MKRGGPLPRTTPLARGGKQLARNTAPIARAPMARTSAKPYPECDEDGCTNRATRKGGGPCPLHKEKPATSTAKPPRPGIPADVRALVLHRAAGRCEACGREFRDATPHLHHRRRRREGGHTLDNLVALHPNCHVVAPEAVHQRPAWAAERGLIVRTGSEPATTPLVLASGRSVYLDPGSPTYLTEASAA